MVSIDACLYRSTSVTSKTGIKSNIKPPPPPETLILDVHSFDEVVLVSDHLLRYLFKLYVRRLRTNLKMSLCHLRYVLILNLLAGLS
jgi:hypothetical protein